MKSKIYYTSKQVIFSYKHINDKNITQIYERKRLFLSQFTSSQKVELTNNLTILN